MEQTFTTIRKTGKEAQYDSDNEGFVAFMVMFVFTSVVIIEADIFNKGGGLWNTQRWLMRSST